MIRFAHFADNYKMASPIKLLQNEGARPPIEALVSEASKSLACFKLQAVHRNP